MSFTRRAFMVLWKDVLVERRSKDALNALVFFSLMLLFLFQFALGADRALLGAALPGLLWLGFVLAGLLALGRSFLIERENDCWESLLLAPGDKAAIYLGKLAGNLVVMFAVEALLLFFFAVFFNIEVAGALPALLAVMALGTVGLAALGTLFAAMTAHLRAREVLFPVLVLPLEVPILLGTVKATEAVLSGEGLASVSHWLSLLGAADIVFVAVGILTFEFILEG